MWQGDCHLLHHGVRVANRDPGLDLPQRGGDLGSGQVAQSERRARAHCPIPPIEISIYPMMGRGKLGKIGGTDSDRPVDLPSGYD